MLSMVQGECCVAATAYLFRYSFSFYFFKWLEDNGGCRCRSIKQFTVKRREDETEITVAFKGEPERAADVNVLTDVPKTDSL